MSVRLPVAECGKCGAVAPVVDWRQSALGVAYLIDAATGAEHGRTCAGVSPRALPVAVRPAPVAEPVRVHVNGYTPRRDLAPEPVAGGMLMRGVGGVRVFVPDPPAREPEPEPAQLLPEPEPEPEPEPDGAELEYAERMDAAEADARRAARRRDWPELRRRILGAGGMSTGGGRWPKDWIPADLYRVHGQSPDVIAAETVITTTGGHGVIPWASAEDGNLSPSVDAMFEYLHRSWSDWRDLQEERRYSRRPRAATVTPAQALAEPARATDPMRSATLNLARLVADVADLVADGRAPRDLARTLANAARMLAEAQP